MASKGFDLTPITRLYGMSDTDYNSARHNEELDMERYDPYTLYFVNHGLNTSGNLADDDDENDGEYTQYADLYYGKRKVTDVFVTKDYPGNQDYPDDKIYLVPVVRSEGGWELGDSPNPDGEFVVAQPVGYNVYFKHNGIVTAVSTSAIQSVNYNLDTKSVVLTWMTDNDGQVVTSLLTQDNLADAFKDLPQEAINTIIQRAPEDLVYGRVSLLVKSEQIDPLDERLSGLISDNRDDIDSIKGQLKWKVYQ